MGMPNPFPDGPRGPVPSPEPAPEPSPEPHHRGRRRGRLSTGLSLTTRRVVVRSRSAA